MDTPATTEVAEARTLWRRLHRSSRVFAGGLAAILLLVNIPGQIIVGPDISSGGKYGPSFHVDEHCEHGWPAVWLQRESFMFNVQQRSSRRSPWRLHEGMERFSAVGLLVDLVTAIAIVLIGGTIFELWRRRRPKLLQLQLGELLVLVALSAVCAAVLAAHGRRHQRELELLQLVEDTPDGNVEWGGPVGERVDWQPGGPSWLQDLVDLEWFRRFDRAVGIEATGEELKHAVQLRNLKVVRLSGDVSNDDLQALEQCSRLEALDMGFANLDDPRAEAVDHDGDWVESYFRLPALPKLRGLNMYGTSFRGEGLEHLVAIEVLELSDTDLDNEGLSRLTKATRLKALSVGGTKIGNEGLRHIADLTELEELWLSSTEIDDQGLVHLAKLRNLIHLSVDTGLTDAAIPILKRFTRLESLVLNSNVMNSTHLTDRGLRELQNALPNCHISK